MQPKNCKNGKNILFLTDRLNQLIKLNGQQSSFGPVVDREQNT
jgi:hypothetical protein